MSRKTVIQVKAKGHQQKNTCLVRWEIPDYP